MRPSNDPDDVGAVRGEAGARAGSGFRGTATTSKSASLKSFRATGMSSHGKSRWAGTASVRAAESLEWENACFMDHRPAG